MATNPALSLLDISTIQLNTVLLLGHKYSTVFLPGRAGHLQLWNCH